MITTASPRPQTAKRLVLFAFLFGLPLTFSLVWAAIPPRQIPSLSAIVDVGQMIRGQGHSRRGHVVDIRSRRVFRSDQAAPNPALVSNMMAQLVMKLTGQPTGQAAWGTWFGPGDKVGILVDAAGTPFSRVQTSTVAAIVGGLRAAGVYSNDIIVWAPQDKTLSPLASPSTGPPTASALSAQISFPSTTPSASRSKAASLPKRSPSLPCLPPAAL